MLRIKTKKDKRLRRHLRLRKKIKGTPERPRLCVFRADRHIYAQIIDDTKGHTLVSASTLQSPLKETIKNGGNIEAAVKVGEQIAKLAIEKGIKRVVFDRGGYTYHGRVAALADAARKGGLEF